MPLTIVQIALAPKGSELYEQASTVLEAFGDLPLDEYYVDGEEQPPIICVGFAGNIAVTAAACYEVSAEPPSRLASLEVALIATDEDHRRKGYGKQLVSSIVNLAIKYGFDHVEADPKDNDAILFWGDCGLNLQARGVGDSDMYRNISGREFGNVDFEVVVSNEVNMRLSIFTHN